MKTKISRQQIQQPKALIMNNMASQLVLIGQKNAELWHTKEGVSYADVAWWCRKLPALSQTLAEIPHTKPDKLPRMADYALFAIAAEKALGLKTGEFMKTFNHSREESRQVVIESSPIGEAILKFMENQLMWKGTASELLLKLAGVTDEATYRSRYWPKASNTFKRQLHRLAPDLKALGIELIETREGKERTRFLVLEKVVKISSLSSASEREALKPFKKGTLTADGRRTILTQADDKGPADDTRTIIKNNTVRPENIAQQGLKVLADDKDDIFTTFSGKSETDLEKLNPIDLNWDFIPGDFDHE